MRRYQHLSAKETAKPKQEKLGLASTLIEVRWLVFLPTTNQLAVILMRKTIFEPSVVVRPPCCYAKSNL